jgi:sensor histidine kinase YesM
VENASWHGLMHKEEGGTVWVKVVQHQDDLLLVSIRDNGVGRTKAMELKSKSATKRKSFGMKLTGDRLELINQLYQTQTQVQILDLMDATGQPAGTEVMLQIPV